MTNKVGRPKKEEHEKADPKEIMICPICGYEYQRRNRARHQRSKICKMHLNLNNKIKKFIYNDSEQGGRIKISEFRSKKILERLNNIDNNYKHEDRD